MNIDGEEHVFMETVHPDIFDRPDIYELSVREELRELGATQNEYALLSQELIWNNFVKRRLPQDVAWAIMQ